VGRSLVYRTSMDWDMQVRLAAFHHIAGLERQQRLLGGGELAKGFEFEGQRITLKGQTGIWIPKQLRMPISITTRLNGPYNLDSIDSEGITYAYRGTNPDHHQNQALREACRLHVPLLYFLEVRDHLYQAVWPVYIIDDIPGHLYVKAVVDPAYRMLSSFDRWETVEPSSDDVRRYATIETRVRLHQSAFREIVLHAYQERCAMCALKHPQLLDAAHIIPDSDERGFPVVSNGLSLCKIHHAAFDCGLLGVDPDFTIHVRPDILEESDGPMLQHGLKELEQKTISVPNRRDDWPNRAALERRYRSFLE